MATNEIYPFGDQCTEERGDILSLADYEADVQRRIGNQPGIARQELVNRVLRQAAHIAAGSAQFLASRHTAGVKDDGDLDAIEEAWRDVIQGMIDAGAFAPLARKIATSAPLAGGGTLDKDLALSITAGTAGHVLTSEGEKAVWKALAIPDKYDLCEIYYFRHPTLKPGFQPAQGGLLENAPAQCPRAWEYLQTEEGQKLCKTEEEWQALTTATWATLADGSTVGWDGIGGAPWYVQDLDAGTLRLPDLRGMYAEAAGFDSLGVGGGHGDGVRNITGLVHGGYPNGWIQWDTTSGACYATSPGTVQNAATNAYGQANLALGFDASRVVPTANKVQPRAWGALACVYLGQPAS